MILIIDERIRLELTNKKHAKDLYKAVDENRIHLSQFLPWVSFMQSSEDMRRYLTNCELLYQQENEVSFVIFFDEKIIGRIGIHHINILNKNGAIGYWITKDAEGKGIISKSCEALIRYGFQKLNLQRIEIKAATANLKSQSIPERLNFTREGILRQSELVNNQFLDIVVYSLLKEEWEKG